MIIDSLNKLNQFVATGEYMNAYDFINPLYTLTYIIDKKGTGKSTAFMNLCIDKTLKGDNFAWIRNTLNEFQASQVGASFNKAFAERGLLDKYVATEKGVYEIIKVNDKREQRILVGMFGYASNFLANASQNSLKLCKGIVGDEFINPDFTKPNLFGLAMRAFDTYKRKNVAHVFLLANKNTSASDMLEGSGVEFDGNSNENQVYFDKDSSTQAFYIGQHDITANEESVQQIQKWGKYNSATRAFYEGYSAMVPNRNVVNGDRNDIAKIFHPIGKFTLNQQDFCLGKLDNGCFYIKALFSDREFMNVKGGFCFFPKDKTDYNVYLHPQRDKTHLKTLINAYSSGILYYDGYNTQEVLKTLLGFINLLTAPERNTI